MIDRSFTARFGPEVARAGVDIFPRALFELMVKEGLSRRERLVLLGLLTAWREGGAPRVSARVLALRSGLSERSVVRSLRQLEARGFIRVIRHASPERGFEANEYDLQPLIDRLEQPVPQAGGSPAPTPLENRFGPGVASGGLAAIPARLRFWTGPPLSAGERLVLVALLSAKWDGKNPRLPVSELARRAGLSRRGVYKALTRLAQAGLIRRGSGPGEFDISGLLDQLRQPNHPSEEMSDGGQDCALLSDGTVNSCQNNIRSIPLEATHKKQHNKKQYKDIGAQAADSNGMEGPTNGREGRSRGRPPGSSLQGVYQAFNVRSMPAGLYRYYCRLLERYGAERLEAACRDAAARGCRFWEVLAVEDRCRRLSADAPTAAAVEAWEQVKGFIKADLSPMNFRTWVEPLTPVALEGGRLIVEGRPYVVDWVVPRLRSVFRRAALKAGLEDVEVRPQ